MEVEAEKRRDQLTNSSDRRVFGSDPPDGKARLRLALLAIQFAKLFGEPLVKAHLVLIAPSPRIWTLSAPSDKANEAHELHRLKMTPSTSGTMTSQIVVESIPETSQSAANHPPSR